MAKIKHVTIDQDECVGCETCVELCPDVFEFDEDSQKAFVKEDYKNDEACIQEAIESCPTECIAWEDE
jgi:ferredoxin